MKAVLLAAGEGTRLAPLTDSVPKILVPLGDEPLLAHQIRYLERSGVSSLGINIHHRADQVREFLADLKPGVEVHISEEQALLGTAGALRPFGTFLDEPFVVLYGDVVTDMDLGQLMEAHRRAGGIATVVYYESDYTHGKGVCEFDDLGQLTAFIEKGAPEGEPSNISAGVYALDPRILEFIGEGNVDFGFDVWPRALGVGERVYGYRLPGYLKDVGLPETLAEAERDLAGGELRW